MFIELTKLYSDNLEPHLPKISKNYQNLMF